MQNLFIMHSDFVEVIGFTYLQTYGCLNILFNGIALYPRDNADTKELADGQHYPFIVSTQDNKRIIHNLRLIEAIKEKVGEGIEEIPFRELPNQTYIIKK